MSLLDDVSIVVTPNGYKAGELFAVVPVPTEGADEIVDGNFPDGSTAWALNGWTISGNAANCSGITANMIQNISGSTNKQFLITFTISNYISGSVRPAFVGGYNYSSAYNVNGVYTTVISSYSDIRFVFYSNSFNGSVSNVSVKEYTSADMDVTRETAATRVDENGLVNYAEVLGGEKVTDGNFPLGTTAWTLASSSTGIEENKAVITSTGGNARISQEISGTSGDLLKVTFNISDEVSTGLAYVRIDGTDIQPSGSWASGTATVYYTLVSSGAMSLQFMTYGTNTASFTLKDVSIKQIQRDNVPRIDYTGGGCPHILAEPMRTNDFAQSNDFANAYWSKNSTAIDTSIGTDGIQSNISTSPDGTLNADRVNFLVQSDKDLGLAKSIGSSVGTTHSSSVWLKGEGSNIGKDVIIRVKRSSGGSYVAVNKTVTLTSIWQRAELEPLTLITDNIGVRTILSSNDATNCLIYGFQLEVGSYPTSYIPTSGSTVTRNQDIFTRDGIGSLINSTEGVLFLDMAALSNDLTYREISLSDGTSTNRVEIRYGTSSNSIQAIIRNGSYVILQHNLSTIVDSNKVAFKWKTGDFALWVNGVEVATDTTAFVTSGLNRLAFDQGTTGNTFFGKVKQLQVYDTSLSDEQLLQLTGESGTDFYESYAEMASALTYTIQ